MTSHKSAHITPSSAFSPSSFFCALSGLQAVTPASFCPPIWTSDLILSLSLSRLLPSHWLLTLLRPIWKQCVALVWLHSITRTQRRVNVLRALYWMVFWLNGTFARQAWGWIVQSLRQKSLWLWNNYMVDGICPGYLKALGAAGLSWPLHHCMDIGAVPLKWQTKVGGPD